MIGLTDLSRLYYLHSAGITGQPGFIEIEFKIATIGVGTIGTNQHSPGFINLVITTFLGKVYSSEQVSSSGSAFGLDKLLIEIDLANIIQVQIAHVLSRSKSYQIIGQQIIVVVEIGSLCVVSIGQLIGLVGNVGQ